MRVLDGFEADGVPIGYVSVSDVIDYYVFPPRVALGGVFFKFVLKAPGNFTILSDDPNVFYVAADPDPFWVPADPDPDPVTGR